MAIHEGAMLKITVVDSVTEQKVMVEGKLAEPWVSELKSAWNQARQAGGDRPIVVDLRGVTAIDLKGEAALETMIAEGARLAVKGLYSEYVVGRLMNRAQNKRVKRHQHDGVGIEDSSPTEKPGSGRKARPSQESGRPRPTRGEARK